MRTVQKTNPFDRLEHEQIRYARERLEYREADWLRRKGWKSTSATPGCLWMWEKEIDGRVILLSQATAAYMQAEIDANADYDAHPEDYEE